MFTAPEDGPNHRAKHVELIGIINKPLLFHLVGCLYYSIYSLFNQLVFTAPEDGPNHRAKHVELIGIINKPLLLHLVVAYVTVSVMHGQTDIRVALDRFKWRDLLNFVINLQVL